MYLKFKYICFDNYTKFINILIFCLQNTENLMLVRNR